MDQRHERDAVGQSRGPADCPQKDRVKAPQRGQEIFRRHPPVTVVVGHAPVEAPTVEMEPADNVLGSLDHCQRGVQDFRPDPVARVKGDAVGFQSNYSAFPTSCGSLVGPKPTFDSEFELQLLAGELQAIVTMNGVS